MKTANLSWLAIGLGFVIFIIPLMFGPGRDPFDEGINYAVWMGGAFLAALGLAIYRPEGTWKWALRVAFGFPAAVIFHMILSANDYNLLPLTLILSFFIGLLPAFAGAGIGKLSGLLFRNK